MRKMATTFDEIHEFVQNKIYPSSCYGDPGKKKKFRRAAAKFHLQEGILHRMVKRGSQESCLRVIRDVKEREEIVSGAPAGYGDSVESKALGGHLGFDKTEEKIASRVWWPSIRKDVRSFIKTCDRCQRRAPRIQKGSEQLHPVEIPPHPWSQIGVDICSMPTSKEGYTCMVVAVDYFSKWIEAEALHRKSAEAVANFLYNCICRHGCFDIQINDRGREFVNSVSADLHRLTGVKQKVTSPYHPQANGLVERSNRTIQDMMMKLLNDASLVHDWPKALPGILFALRTSKHGSTKYSPFFLIYGREPKLPVEMKVQEIPASQTQSDIECASTDQHSPDEEQMETKTACLEPEHPPRLNETAENLEISKRSLDVSYNDIRQRVELMETLRKKTSKDALANIKKAQERQKKQYNRKRAGSKFCTGETVLMFNLRRADRKGGKTADVWLGPYEIVRQLPNGTYELANNGVLLKNKVSGNNLKPYFKQQCSLLSTSPLPKPIPTTGTSSSPVTQTACNILKSPVKEITVIVETLPPEAVFNPTDITWRKLKYTQLGMPAPQEIPVRPSTEYLGPPKATNPILGDGNCFFRAMSLEITGSQEYHEHLRAVTVSFMRENQQAFGSYIGMDVETYLNTSGMENVCTWGTDVEILCLATLLQTGIYVYTVIGGPRRWIPYKPYFTSSSTDGNTTSQAVYLSNMCAHFERVVSVQPTT